MKIEPTSIDGMFVIQPKKIGDEHGFFSEVYRRDALHEAGARVDWVQENHVLSTARGIVRGLHFQTAPFAQAKILRVVRGAIYDVVVDIRRTSPTYGAHVGIELSAQNWAQLYVPEGMAHGYCTLSEDCEVLYKVSAMYAPQHEGGLRWDDPALAIEWPIKADEATLNARDRSWPSFETFQTPFD